jgi:hypothetical protein
VTAPVERFCGSVTGRTRVTELVAFAEATGRPVFVNAMPLWSAARMVEAHEWDRTAAKRREALVRLIAREGRVRPLVLTEAEPGGGFGQGAGIYLLDGWHRFRLLADAAGAMGLRFVKFPNWQFTREELKAFQ